MYVRELLGSRGATFTFWLGGVIVVATVYAGLTIASVLDANRSKAQLLARLTEAFMQAYADHRSEGSAIPAAHRRVALEHYTETARNFNVLPMTMSMPGLPGYEIGVVARTPEIADVISGFEAGSQEPVQRVFYEDGRIIDQSIFPAAANAESCVTCHNALESSRIWEQGDIMGALVTETDMTPAIAQIGRNTGSLVVATMLLFAVALGAERWEARQNIDALQRRADHDRKNASQRVQFLAYSDPLTGVGNRTAFSEYLAEVMDAPHEFVLGFVDADKFKWVNDTFGHATGDALLVEFAERIAQGIGEHGRVFRLGGDEFAFIMSERDPIDADRIGATLAKACRAPLTVGKAKLEPSASLGLVSSRELVGFDTDDVFQAADFALYVSKEGGRARHTTFEGEICARYVAEHHLKVSLARALEDGAFSVNFQPQQDLATGNIRGFEALARWNRNGEIVSPSVFVQYLEQSGQICELDFLVLDEGLAQLKAWDAAGRAPVSLSINLSGLHFKRNSALAQRVLDVLNSHGVDPNRLIVEITEGLFLDDWQEVNGMIHDLQVAGIRVALDDFGTGYSSLAYLRNLDFDEIKIDRAFLSDLETSTETQFVLEGVVDIACGLKREVVVEGVETEAQRLIAKEFGAHVSQGYLIGAPMSGEEASQLIPAKTPRAASL